MDKAWVYAAVADCLPAIKTVGGRQLRPIKIGKTQCLCDRLKGMNNGSITQIAYDRIKAGLESSISDSEWAFPLAGCIRWKIIAWSEKQFSHSEATILEKAAQKVLKDAYGRWPYFEAEKKVQAAALDKRSLETNGLGEIYFMDLEMLATSKVMKSLSPHPALRKLFDKAVAFLRSGDLQSFEVECSTLCGASVLAKISNQNAKCLDILPDCKARIFKCINVVSPTATRVTSAQHLVSGSLGQD